MKKLGIYIVFFLFSLMLTSQTKQIDSLLQLARKADDVESRFKHYADASWSLIDVDLEKAVFYLDSAYHIAKKHNYKKGVINTYYKYSVVNRALGRYDKALSYLDKYQKEIKGDTLNEANTFFQKGVLNSIKGNSDQAIENYLKALKYYEELKSDRGKGITYNTLGMEYSAIKRYDESIDYYKKSRDLLKLINDDDGLASTYNNLANVYDYINEEDTALVYFNKSLKLSEKTQNIRRIAHIKENMAAIYKQRNSYSKSLTYATEAYQILKKNNYKGESVNSAALIGEIYALMGDYKRSEKILMEQLNDLKVSALSKKKVYYGLTHLYEKSERYKKALEFYKKYKAVSDSIVNKSSLENLNKLQIQYDTEKKDKELVTKNLEIEQQQKELEKKKTQNIFMLGSVIALAVVSILIWLFFLQRQKRKNQELLTLKREFQIKTLESLIEGEEKERLRVAKELHDGVNGDLSAIKYKLSSLLEMNNSVIKETITMIDDSCKQVRAISHNLIPPSLENFNLMEATLVYCNNLNDVTEGIEITFQHLGDSVELPKKAEVNIFRIIQELVANGIRHAKASKIDVQISSRENTIQITVEDNGKGFDKNNIESDGIGLSNVQSRVDYLNATTDFISNNQGTSYTIDIDKNKVNGN